MSGRSSTSSTILHAWDVIIKFYELKGGAEFNSAPARRLSRSFGLDLAPSLSNNKQVNNVTSFLYDFDINLFSVNMCFACQALKPPKFFLQNNG